MFLGCTAEISIIIRTDNGEQHLEELLALIRDQQTPYETEVIAVDAGSTDRTPLILRSRGIRSLHCSRGDAYLGKVLEATEGDVVIFLTQDTLPLNNGWLFELVTPLFEEDGTGIAHGRLIADAEVPPYPRGLIAARPYISGKQRLHFAGRTDGPGASFLPPTNLGFTRKALEAARNPGLQLPELLEPLYETGAAKVYLPDASAVLKGGFASDSLFAASERTGGPSRSLVSTLLSEIAGLWEELSALSLNGDLPNGQRGEAYATAIALHAQKFLRLFS